MAVEGLLESLLLMPKALGFVGKEPRQPVRLHSAARVCLAASSPGPWRPRGALPTHRQDLRVPFFLPQKRGLLSAKHKSNTTNFRKVSFLVVAGPKKISERERALR